MSSKVKAFVIGLVWLFSSNSFAQVQVTLPSSYYGDQEVALPVSVGDVTGQEIFAFLSTISFDPDVFEITGLDAVEDLAEDFALVINTLTPGVVTITGAHTVALEGEGTLFRLLGQFKSPGTTDITFDSFTFNEGNPVAATQNGQISNTVFISNEDESRLPESFKLRGNYPNPFNPTTSIQFDLPEVASVRLNVVDLLGRVVLSVPERWLEAGPNHSIQIDASELASGVYLYQVIAEGAQRTYHNTAAMTLVK